MTTATLSCVPMAPAKDAGVTGHAKAPDLATQTSPAVVTVTEMEIEWAIDPLMPVICTENVPAELPVTVSVAVPEPVMVAGLIVALSPDGTATLRETTPENPLSDVTLIVEVPEEPRESTMLEGLADKPKSGLPVPVTVTTVVNEFTSLPS
jgi:hypothetical protein